jgi:predicted acyl esterase
MTSSSVSESQSYQADAPALQVDEDPEELFFSYTFKTKSHMVGYSKAVLYMSCPDYDDLDVFVQLRKTSADGTLLQNLNIPLKDLGLSSPSEVTTVNTNKYLGPSGILRASRRAIDVKLSKKQWLVHSHTAEEEQKVLPGKVVRLEIGIWPTGIVFEVGERLVFKIAGHPLVLAEFEPLRGKFVAQNKGRHHVHFGGEFDSHVMIPLVTL